MSKERWDRLAADLKATGFEVKITERSYNESVRGRVVNGISRSITFRVPGMGLITVSDKWWAKNPSVWLGWQVYSEGCDSIVIWESPLSKNRSEIVTAFRAAAASLAKEA